jgi:hypothetical protein
MLSNVNNYNLVVYCDNSSKKDLEKYESNPRIKTKETNRMESVKKNVLINISPIIKKNQIEAKK